MERDATSTYNYTNNFGQSAYRKRRHENPKRFIWESKDGAGRWKPGLNGATRYLYRLPELISSGEDRVWLPEGEKDVEALRSLGFTATTSGGASDPWFPEFNKYFTDRNVVILTDTDGPGWDRGNKLVAELLPVAKSVRVVSFAGIGLPDHSDVSDWLALGHTLAELEALADATPAAEHAESRHHEDIDERVISHNTANNSSSLIVNAYGKPKSVLANAITTLREAPEWQGVLRFSEFGHCTVAVKPTPWGKPSGTNWTDIDDVLTADWLQRHGILVGPQIVADAVQAIAAENHFHPVKDYLESLEWDKTKRLDTWLDTCLGVTRTPFTQAVGSRWLISAVARIYQPGCQADHTLLLEGPQGIKKSTVLSILAVRPEWFTDHISDFHNKDSRIELHGVWIVELAELASIRRSLNEKVKSFLTARKDHFRLPYGRRAVDVPRTNVFAGSVNDATPFTDETGNRRFWPVLCGKVDTDAALRDRDQLWAEALHLYRAGTHWWLDTDELNRLASDEQEQRYEPGVWDDVISTWLENPTQRNNWDAVPFSSDTEAVTITDILLHAVGKHLENCSQADRNQVARCLTHLGWTQTRRLVDGVKLRFYARTR